MTRSGDETVLSFNGMTERRRGEERKGCNRETADCGVVVTAANALGYRSVYFKALSMVGLRFWCKFYAL